MEEIFASLIGFVVGLLPWLKKTLDKPGVKAGLDVLQAVTPTLSKLAAGTDTKIDDVAVDVTTKAVAALNPRMKPADVKMLQEALRGDGVPTP